MKMKKKYIMLIVLFAALVVTPMACKKSFLTQTNTFSSTVESTFNKPQDVIALVNSIYDTYQNSDFMKKSMWYYANFLTHDWYNNGNDIVWNNYTIPSTFAALSTFWNDSYVGIGRANAALPIIAEAKAKGVITSDLADRLTGETLFLRGMTYYYLTGTFGGVPLELNTSTTTPSNGLTPRSTQAQCFAQIISDMKQAETLLLSKTTLPAADLGRATKGAAYAYEGSAQMWLGNYTAALAAFNNPELTNNYHLIPQFLNVHEFNNQNNDESLFEVQFDLPDGGTQDWAGSWQPPGGELGWIDSFGWPSEITGQGYDYGSPALEYSYQDGDSRKLATIIGPGDPNISPGIIAQWGGIKGYPYVTGGYAAYLANPTGDVTDKNRYTDGHGNIINTNGTAAFPWYGTDGTPRSGYTDAKKWRDPNLTGGSGPQKLFGSQNQVLMRYAEVLLSRAECKIRTGDVAGGLADINLVRARAFGGTPPAVWQDGLQVDGTPAPALTDPMQKVLSEYRHELTAEYSLMYLLRRAGTDPVTNKPYDMEFIHNVNHVVGAGPDNNTSPIIYPYGPTSDGKTHGVTYNDLPPGRDILPIPQVAIGLNPNLKQNPGY
jgi:hypothetical protein